MAFHQARNDLYRTVIKAQPSKDLFGHGGSNGTVSLKMASVFVLGIAKGLSDVMQEDGEADEEIVGCVRKRAQGMLQDVVAMVFGILLKAAAGEKLG